MYVVIQPFPVCQHGNPSSTSNVKNQSISFSFVVRKAASIRLDKLRGLKAVHIMHSCPKDGKVCAGQHCNF